MVKFRWEMEFRETEIGEMPKDWETKELGKVIKINKKPRNTDKKPIAFISMENIPEDGLYPKFEVKNPNEVKSGIEVFSGSLLLAKITPSFEHGKSCIVPKESNYKWVATIEVFSILPKDDMVDLLYLFYFFKFPVIREGLQYTMTGTSGRQRVPKDALEQLEIPYPPPEEQTRIATVLSWFDDLIENKRKQNEILEKMAMAIFKSWFIDFEPFQDEEFVYNEELDMEIPKGWEIRELKNIAEVIMGQSPPSKYYNQEGRGLPFIQGKGQFGQYTPHTDTYSTQISKMAKPFDILVTVRAPVGELNIADREYVIGRGIAALRSEFWTFLYVYLKTYNEILKSFERGTTFDAITKPELESIKILLPPQSILQRFHFLVEPIFKKIINNQKEIIILKKIQDTLLPQLVFGRLRVEGL